ncbi:MAG: D-alanine--D-alanine ligase [Alphaproteobacteria bacterium]|nr:D-alanine--D-alanine ligase [Alphaproteobacteria bacterium]
MSGTRKRVAVLKGGFSNEREVSLVSGAQAAIALRQAGYAVSEIDVTRDLAALVAALAAAKPDAAFNALHGRWGEDGCMQGILEHLAIPYTHSGVLASALAMDKPAAKAVFAAAGLPVVAHKLLDARDLGAGDPLPQPYVLKPANEGSSVGVFIVGEGSNRLAEAAATWRYGRIMAEPFVPGRELTVAVMGGRALAVTEIETHRGFYDYDAKYVAGGSNHVIPARIHPDAYAEAMRIALAAHQALGCRGVSRADLRYDDTKCEPGRLVLLEVNTQPGMTPTSLVPEQAAHCGIDFASLCAWLVEEARCDG